MFCYIVLLPVLALFFYVRVIPIGFSFVAQLLPLEPRSASASPFIGLENYIALLSDDNFLLALSNTTIYSRLAPSSSARSWRCRSPCSSAAGSRLSAFYQTIYFLPVITPLVPMSIAWKWIYDYNYGILNYGLSLFGIPAVPWLTDPDIALWALVIMGVWKVLGYNMVLFLVGIRNIPAEYLEAASLDGATAWQRFRQRHAAAAAADPAVRARHLDDQRLQRVHPGLCDDARLAIGARAGGADAGVRHLPERLSVLPHGLCLGRGGHR